MNAYSHIRLRDTHYLPYLVIRRAIEPKHYQSLLKWVQTLYQPVHLPELLQTLRRFVDERHLLRQTLMLAMPTHPGTACDASVDTNSVNPRAQLRPIRKAIDARPQIRKHLLLQIVEIVEAARIHIAHLRYKRSVALYYIAEHRLAQVCIGFG